ncbi:hypothetical protein WISP_129178 [Willisornis vidua]|uniref:Uncharacterized protein n=1 Tax=Willisornis vidua TaxID=1566151 RepID=A0ABQ9CQ02_9PASS|nr:hypothetical protein WISP_129178 [Willisornis vidua]
MDEALYGQLEVAPKSRTLDLAGDFSYPDICWRKNKTKHKRSLRFMESTDDDFLSQIVEDRMKNGVLLNLMLSNREGLIGVLPEDCKRLGVGLAVTTMRL